MVSVCITLCATLWLSAEGWGWKWSKSYEKVRVEVGACKQAWASSHWCTLGCNFKGFMPRVKQGDFALRRERTPWQKSDCSGFFQDVSERPWSFCFRKANCGSRCVGQQQQFRQCVWQTRLVWARSFRIQCWNQKLTMLGPLLNSWLPPSIKTARSAVLNKPHAVRYFCLHAQSLQKVVFKFTSNHSAGQSWQTTFFKTKSVSVSLSLSLFLRAGCASSSIE